MAERGDNLSEQLIGIAHSNDYEGALKIKDMIAEQFGCQHFIISEWGCNRSHVGAGTYPVFPAQITKPGDGSIL